MEQGFSYEAYFEKYDRLVWTNVGVSMLPLLRQGRDVFVVEKRGADRLRVGDVALYRRPPDKYVLHRVVEVREKDYVILGDNCVNREYGITDDDILGVMTAFVRDGKQHTVNDRSYRLYTFLILRTERTRIFCKRALGFARAAVKRLLGIRRTKA